MSGCPVRKLEPDGRVSSPALELVQDDAGDRWVVRSFGVARQVLRDSEATRQAGFGAESVRRGSESRAAKNGGSAASPAMRPPILYLEGPDHRRQRSAAARFFAPKVIEDYRPMMTSLSEQLVARLRPDRDVDLRGLAMELAVQVAGRVVGLTNSSTRGMSCRLDTFFAGNPLEVGRGRGPVALLQTLRFGTATARFYYLDVKPAIRARRRRPQEDVISQLLADGFSDLEILTECVTYAAAGMATTRELICMAAWHLLDDADLLARYRAGSLDDRAALLSETLRLEPVVGHLYRRLTQPLLLDVAGEPYELAPGSLVDLDLRAVNADADTVGEEPYGLCPGRELPRTVPAAVMGFGDGHHRCPGGPLAILETEIFLSALFAHDVVAGGPPRVHWNAVSQGYDLDQFRVRAAA
ncbi:cytochrome P450 [uncultured Friedmanniella sp.]|uniref:cytochrome P450 n=1 Tax=uncultured Friedmanniella sp. TaxID=335381 RepID=UPI0035C9FE34